MYQMKAAEGDYQPALCAMGDKHQYGQEGIPQDYDYAFSKLYSQLHSYYQDVRLYKETLNWLDTLMWSLKYQMANFATQNSAIGLTVPRGLCSCQQEGEEQGEERRNMDGPHRWW